MRSFIHWHKLRHPAVMGKHEVEAYLTWLACQRSVSPSTHRQALSALLFLYKEVLEIELPWLDKIGRPRARERLPTVLSREEVEPMLSLMEGEVGLLARLLYGTGMRLVEGLRLRVKDVDFDRRSIIVREARAGRSRRDAATIAAPSPARTTRPCASTMGRRPGGRCSGRRDA